MKKICTFIILFTLIFQPWLGPSPSTVAQGGQPVELASPQAQTASDSPGMPGWPLPDKPIPHNQPGQPARGGDATYQVTRLNALGEQEMVELGGLDALLANGTMSDPLQGNYRLVSLDKFMFSSYAYGSTNNFSVQNYEFVTPTFKLIPGSTTDYGNHRFNAIAAGDLNGDYVDEQIAAWVNPGNPPSDPPHIMMSIGELPTSFGKALSAPAPVAYPDGSLDLVVQGYDRALWILSYDGASWGEWGNEAGGLLVSGPAVASRAAGELDVFAVGADNQVYQNHWSGSDWISWTQVYTDQLFSDYVGVLPLPEIPAPAVAGRGGTQLDLFRRGPANTLRWNHADHGTTWGEWQDLGGMLASGPGAVSLGDGRMQVYALGMDGALWYRTYDSGWGGWQRLETPAGVAQNAVPALVSPAVGHVEVYLAGMQNDIWTNSYNGSNWNGWSNSEVLGELGLGIGAGSGPSGTYLFAQMGDGSLQYRLNASAWSSLADLDVSQTRFDTGAMTIPLPRDDDLENPIFDLTTGYFTGDGRQQVALAYAGADQNLRLEIYDMQDGFKLGKTAEITPIATGSWPRIAAGDVNGDGLDEIGFVYVIDTPSDPQTIELRVFQIEQGSNGNWSGNLPEISSNEVTIDDGGDIEHGWPFGGTLRIAAGDIIPDQGSNNDEFAVVSDWRHDIIPPSPLPSREQLRVFLHVYDYQQPASQFTEELNIYNQAEEVVYWNERFATGVGLAVGDVNGDLPGDEVIVTSPYDFAGHDYPDIRRSLKVYAYDTEQAELVEKGSWDVNNEEYSRCTFLDTLAVGDLDQDLKNEIVMASHYYKGDVSGPIYHLDVYEFESLSSGPLFSLPISFDALPRAFNLAMGDFTGESVRVGPPSYRVQNRVDTMVTIINMPPKQRDLVKDSAGNYKLIVSPDETCTPSASDPNCTHAKYANTQFQSSQQTIQTVHAYSLSAGLEQEACAGGGIGVVSLKLCVTNSINTTHGANFEKSTDTISSYTYESQVIAADDDQLVYFGTPYAVWEYPILTDQTGESDGFITVAFPLIAQRQDINNLGGYLNGNCDENFYAPGHQLNNVWSYDPIGDPLTYKDYDPGYAPIYSSIVSDWASGAITYQDFEKVSDSNTYKHSLSVGTVVKGTAKADLGVVNVESSFKASLNGSYENTSMESDVFTTKDGTTYSYFLGEKAKNLKFQTRVVFYWAKDGYQELNYQTLMGTAWDQVYSKPDPAFILPWYGFPEDPDPARNTYETPPCGGYQRLFSPDLQIKPAYASVGDTVEITATVRNFSNIAPDQPVTVRFYQGDPSLNVLIGKDQDTTIQNLDRQNGPRTVHVTWTASGTGKQKIYAVIDPDNRITEMHDTGDLIDNNTAYGQLEIGAAAFVDMGAAAQQPYHDQSYSQGADTQVSFYLPPANLEAVSRFDLKDSLQIISNAVGKPFELVAFQGSQNQTWAVSLPNFDLRPKAGDPPAVISVAYSDASIAGKNEGNLGLYRKTNSGWELANLTCGLDSAGQPLYDMQRFPQDNLIAVPVCQTSTFVLSAGEPTSVVYLPLVSRR